MDISWLDPSNPNVPFPNVSKALINPEGLLAAGGDLSQRRLLKAYSKGIFPWYEEGQPILWWSPNPRGVLYTEKLYISNRLRRTLRNHPWTITFDGDFKKTIKSCAAPRSYARGTWITKEMIEAYVNLHEQGFAHSVELWDKNEQIIGGIYGVLIGKMFFGESMFSFQTNASKIALVYLVAHLNYWGFPLLDCQLPSKHLESLGAESISRDKYIKCIKFLCNEDYSKFEWKLNESLDIANWNT